MPTALPPSTDFTGAAVTEGGFKSAITALRDYLSGLFGTTGSTQPALAALGAPLSSYVVKSANYTVAAGDKGKTIDYTGTYTLSLLAAATAGDGFTVAVRNGGSGVITIDPNLSETIDGGATLALNSSESLILYCTGTLWIAVGRSSGVPSGSMTAYGGSSAPAGWLLCDGSAVSRTTYASLFAALSTAFGVGDGSTTFNLPDLRGRVPTGKDNMGGTAASRITSGGSGITGTTLGAVGGAETHTLTAAQSGSPAHGHAFSWYVGSGGGADTAYLSDGDSNTGRSNSTNQSASNSVSASSAVAASAAHNNVPPAIITNYIIKT